MRDAVLQIQTEAVRLIADRNDDPSALVGLQRAPTESVRDVKSRVSTFSVTVIEP